MWLEVLLEVLHGRSGLECAVSVPHPYISHTVSCPSTATRRLSTSTPGYHNRTTWLRTAHLLRCQALLLQHWHICNQVVCTRSGLGHLGHPAFNGRVTGSLPQAPCTGCCSSLFEGTSLGRHLLGRGYLAFGSARRGGLFTAVFAALWQCFGRLGEQQALQAWGLLFLLCSSALIHVCWWVSRSSTSFDACRTLQGPPCSLCSELRPSLLLCVACITTLCGVACTTTFCGVACIMVC
jgi:hypothetical protein